MVCVCCFFFYEDLSLKFLILQLLLIGKLAALKDHILHLSIWDANDVLLKSPGCMETGL